MDYNVETMLKRFGFIKVLKSVFSNINNIISGLKCIKWFVI